MQLIDERAAQIREGDYISERIPFALGDGTSAIFVVSFNMNDTLQLTNIYTAIV
jgi:hypothetical protein